MTADGTYPSPAHVTTAAELDALPIGSVVLFPLPNLTAPVPFERRDRGWQQPGSESIYETALMADRYLPAAVLFRPDAPQPRAEDGCVDRDWHAEAHTRGDRLNALVAALHDAFAGRAHDGGFAAGIRGLLDENDRLRRDAPQPATVGDDAVERAARAYHDKVCAETEDASVWEDESEAYREATRDDVRCILAAARAGEAEPRVCTGCTDDHPDGDPGVIHRHYGEHCACGWFGQSWAAHREDCPMEAARAGAVALLAAQRGGEAVDREALAEWLRKARLAKRPTGYPMLTHEEAADAVLAFLAVRGDAAPTVSVGQVQAAVRNLSPTAALDAVQERHILAVLDALGIVVR